VAVRQPKEEVTMDSKQPNFGDGTGLVPVIIQDFASKEVLMLAFMNQQAWQKTLETGEVWLWSRSRQTLWHKGGASGNILKVKQIWLDCDCDSVLLLVRSTGPVCHTGKESCFFDRISGLRTRKGN
jgi:phosphoribosyl-AMP cyclohydrolase